MRLITVMVVFLFICAGCTEPVPLEEVTIVHIGECDEVGEHDQYTIVEFPNGERRRQYRHYGKEGDSFKARRLGSWGWE